MSSKDILLLSPTPELVKLYNDALAENGCKLIAPRKLRSGTRKKKTSSPMVIVESGENWMEGLTDLHDSTAECCTCIIVGSSNILKENIFKINKIASLIFDKNQDAAHSIQAKSTEGGACLVDLLEQKISDFVVRMKAAGGKDLYSLLIMEIERHLIRHILKESGGNQVKAALTLGINRNTLRKKIKELKISLK